MAGFKSFASGDVKTVANWGQIEAQQIAGINATLLRYDTARNKIAQSFTTVGGGTLRAVELMLIKTGSPVANPNGIWCEIWKTQRDCPEPLSGRDMFPVT